MEILEKRTNIGRLRECNEDFVTFIRHPKNKKYKLLAVADGMGGKTNGDIASSYTIKTINKWFISSDLKLINNNDKVIKIVKELIKKINRDLIDKYGKDTLGTTLSMCIINKNNTLVFNVGDSRTYTYKDDNLLQVTEDDSDVWDYHKYLGIKKDYLRFFTSSNVINACIGINIRLCKITTKIIDNDYDMVLLFTDGVTDLVSDCKISKIIKKSKTNEILDNIINTAVNKNQHLSIPKSLKKKVKAKLSIPVRGRDNASGVIYIK